MVKALEIRGLPASLAMDLWWLDQAPERVTAGVQPREAARSRRWLGLLALVVLVALSDHLFYGHWPGLSLAVFAGAVFAAVAVLLPERRGLAGPAALFFLSALPVVEYMQLLSFAILAAGFMASVAWAVLGPEAAFAGITRGALKLLAMLPATGIRDFVRGTTGTVRGLPRETLAARFMRGWAFPLAGLLVLGSLLARANPILLDKMSGIIRGGVLPDYWALHVLFWIWIGLMVWPFLAAALDRARIAPVQGPRVPTERHGFGINAASVCNALIVFNLMLGVQTGFDVVYLWGGAELPEGMTYAEYAHRGAYPLLATAILAGAFALAARPFLDERRGLRGLLLLWLAQNVALVLSSVYRLDLYVEALGLTYLRVHAAIWMVLVALGLVLTVWQIWRRHSNAWLIGRCAVLALAVLYGCSFINFAHLIAANNLARPGGYDESYLYRLDRTAITAFHEAGVEAPCDFWAPRIYGWRDWGFRIWRVNRKLTKLREDAV